MHRATARTVAERRTLSGTLGYQPGELRENITLDFPGFYNLTSGSVIQIGDVRIRLTFHCEPCRIIADGSRLKELIHQRGFLGQVMNSGEIGLGHKATLLPERLPSIPYKPKDRIAWFLAETHEPIGALELVRNVGLADSYVRALPRQLTTLSQDLANKVYFQGRKRN